MSIIDGNIIRRMVYVVPRMFPHAYYGRNCDMPHRMAGDSRCVVLPAIIRYAESYLLYGRWVPVSIADTTDGNVIRRIIHRGFPM